jgi:hypothetical protein
MSDITTSGQYQQALEKTLGRKVTFGEKARLEFATTKLGFGTGGTFEQATPQELANIFGDALAGKLGELEKTLQNMSVEAKVNVTVPTPLTQAGGTPGETKTGTTQ